MTSRKRKQDALHIKIGPVDRLRLKLLAEHEELSASALVRRMIRAKAKELGLENVSGRDLSEALAPLPDDAQVPVRSVRELP